MHRVKAGESPYKKSSRLTGQDKAAKEIKATSRQFYMLFQTWAGTHKDATILASADSYYAGLSKNLPKMFQHGGRWEGSSAEARWNDFVQAWNNGNCSWTDAFPFIKLVNDALQQSE